MEKFSRSLSDRMRRNSFTGLSVDLDYEELEQFLLHVSSFAEDKDIATIVSDNFSGLAKRCRALQEEGTTTTTTTKNTMFGKGDDELNEVINMFDAILTSARDLPPRSVGQIHSFVGMIRTKQNRYDCAIRSFLKALWLQTATQVAGRTTPPLLLEIAMAENRLGLAYGNNGNLPQAISLLEKSLEDYEKAKMKSEHYCVVNAQSSLTEFRSKHLQQKLKRQSSHKKYTNAVVRRLGHIQEEREYHSERIYQSERRLTRW